MIIHIDLDAFYAMVEVRRRPELKGKPVIVGGTSKRGVVATASYEARVHGVRAAVPTAIAKSRCPDGIFLPGDHEEYAEVSKRIMRIFYNYTPHIEPLSLDEAFLDVSGSIHLMGSPYEIAQKIRDEVFSQEGLWCSAGISTQKSIAKIASKKAKPQIKNGKIHEGVGIFEVPSGGEVDFLRPLDITEIWGVGRATNEKFNAHGIKKVGEIADMDFAELEKIVGKAAANSLKSLVEGTGNNQVKATGAPKSISNEETFIEDILTKKEMIHHIIRLSDKVAGRLRKANLKAKRITLKLRYSKGFKTITRDITLPFFIDSGMFIVKKAQELLAQEMLEGGVRLIGIGVSQFCGSDETIQEELNLFEDERGDYLNQWQRIEKTIDEIRYKFEKGSIRSGSSLYSSGKRVTGTVSLLPNNSDSIINDS